MNTWPPVNNLTEEKELHQVRNNQNQNQQTPEWGIQEKKPSPIQELIQESQGTQKQDYSEAAENLKNRRSQNSQEQTEKESESETEEGKKPEFERTTVNEASTEAIVNITDIIIPYALAFRADDLDNYRDYQAHKEAKKDIVDALIRYQEQSGKLIEVPIWLELGFVVFIAYMPAFMLSSNVRKKKKQQKAPFSANQQSQRPQPEAAQAAKKEYAGPVEYYDSNGNPTEPSYWDDVKGGNPVSESENDIRMRQGGTTCKNCGENYAKPGKTACSQHCSGKLQANKLNDQ